MPLLRLVVKGVLQGAIDIYIIAPLQREVQNRIYGKVRQSDASRRHNVASSHRMGCRFACEQWFLLEAMGALLGDETAMLN